MNQVHFVGNHDAYLIEEIVTIAHQGVKFFTSCYDNIGFI